MSVETAIGDTLSSAKTGVGEAPGSAIGPDHGFSAVSGEIQDGELSGNFMEDGETSTISPGHHTQIPVADSEPSDLTGLRSPSSREIRLIPISDLQPSRLQPRRRFEEAEIQGLAESIKQHGLLQPILVRPRPEADRGYEVVCGERRWRAAVVAGLDAVPAIVRDFKDRGVLLAALVENLERQDLTPIEEANGYRRLVENFHLTHASLATLLGKSRSAIANTLRLLDLPGEVQEALQQGEITAGHGRALITADQPVSLLRKIIRKNLSVRETERLSRGASAPRRQRKDAQSVADVDVAALERVISDLLGLRATISCQGKGGAVTLHYANLGELDDFLNRLESLRKIAA